MRTRGERRRGRDGNAPRDHRERRTEQNEIRAEKLPENEDRENPKVSRVVLCATTGTTYDVVDIYIYIYASTTRAMFFFVFVVVFVVVFSLADIIARV